MAYKSFLKRLSTSSCVIFQCWRLLMGVLCHQQQRQDDLSVLCSARYVSASSWVGLITCVGLHIAIDSRNITVCLRWMFVFSRDEHRFTGALSFPIVPNCLWVYNRPVGPCTDSLINAAVCSIVHRLKFAQIFIRQLLSVLPGYRRSTSNWQCYNRPTIHQVSTL